MHPACCLKEKSAMEQRPGEYKCGFAPQSMAVLTNRVNKEGEILFRNKVMKHHREIIFVHEKGKAYANPLLGQKEKI